MSVSFPIGPRDNRAFSEIPKNRTVVERRTATIANSRFKSMVHSEPNPRVFHASLPQAETLQFTPEEREQLNNLDPNWENNPVLTKTFESFIQAETNNLTTELLNLPLDERINILEHLAELRADDFTELNKLVDHCNFSDCIAILKATTAENTHEVTFSLKVLSKKYLREIVQQTAEAVKGTVSDSNKINDILIKSSIKAQKENIDRFFELVPNWQENSVLKITFEEYIKAETNNLTKELKNLPIEQRIKTLEHLAELYQNEFTTLNSLLDYCDFSDCIAILNATTERQIYHIISQLDSFPKDQLREIVQQTAETVRAGSDYESKKINQIINHHAFKAQQEKIAFKAKNVFDETSAFYKVAEQLKGKSITNIRLREGDKTFFVTTDGEIFSPKKGSEGIIGEGGHSKVRALKDESGAETAVISKIFDPKSIDRENYIKILKALPKSSPYVHIPNLVSYEKGDKLQYGLIAPLRNGDLSGFSSPPLPFEMIREIMRDVVLGVKTIHDVEIAHFDLKEANFLYNSEIVEGKLKIKPRVADWDYAEFMSVNTYVGGGTKEYQDPQLQGRTSLNQNESKLADLYAVRIIFQNLIGKKQADELMKDVDTTDDLLKNIENFPDPHIHDPYNETPLHFACKKGDPMILQYFLDQGVDVNQGDIFGNTPLYFAAENIFFVTKLLEKGALNLPNDRGITPFMIACQTGNLKLVNLFLNKGIVDLHQKDFNGKTALQHARNPEIIEFLQNIHK